MNKIARLRDVLCTGVDASLVDIPNGGTLDHVPHGEALDSLVLANTARAVGAANKFNVAAALLVATAISSFLGLDTNIIVSTSVTHK